MKAVYDNRMQLVAWVKDNKYIFTKEMIWVAFIASSHIYTKNRKWLGGYIGGSFLDKRGKPVAWVEGTQPITVSPLSAPQIPLVPLTPLTPMMPLTPLAPQVPMTPTGGWSELSWAAFIS